VVFRRCGSWGCFSFLFDIGGFVALLWDTLLCVWFMGFALVKRRENDMGFFWGESFSFF